MSEPVIIDETTMDTLTALWRAESGGDRLVLTVGPLSALLLVWAAQSLARSPIVAMYPAIQQRYADLGAELAEPLRFGVGDMPTPPV